MILVTLLDLQYLFTASIIWFASSMQMWREEGLGDFVMFIDIR